MIYFTQIGPYMDWIKQTIVDHHIMTTDREELADKEDEIEDELKKAEKKEEELEDYMNVREAKRGKKDDEKINKIIKSVIEDTRQRRLSPDDKKTSIPCGMSDISISPNTGFNATIALFPWTIQMISKELRHVCNGAIINLQVFITSFQCLYEIDEMDEILER